MYKYRSIYLASSFLALFCFSTAMATQKTIEEAFPRMVVVDLLGEKRALIKEDPTYVTHVPVPDQIINPLDYKNWKIQNRAVEDNPFSREIIFKPQEGGWFKDEKRMSHRDSSFFQEDMLYVWTADFCLMTAIQSHHHEISHGDYALCAGVMSFDEDGLIVYLDNASGHMGPTNAQLVRMVADLVKMGGISEFAIIRDYEQNLITVAEALELARQDSDFDGLRHVETPHSIVNGFKLRILTPGLTKTVRKTVPSIVHKFILISAHQKKMDLASGKSVDAMNINGDKDPVLYAKLMDSKPYPEDYDRLAAVYHSARHLETLIGFLRMSMKFMNIKSSELTQDKLLEMTVDSQLSHIAKAHNDLIEAYKNRPSPELYDFLIGRPKYIWN